MSEQQAKAFIAALATDANLRSKVSEAAEQIVQVARDNGYDATQQEIADALKAHWEAEEGHVDPLSHFLSETPGV